MIARRRPLRRRTRLRARSLTNAYRSRERDVPYMLWCKTQPCATRGMGDPCAGAIEAHHAGRHGMGQKAPDDTCIPLCSRHHREPGLLAVPALAAMSPWERRDWVDAQVAIHRVRYMAQTGNGG